jgi:hypothetical protein
MRDSRSVITNSVKGIATEDLAKEMDVSTTRMYEILDRDNPHPKAKQLIRAIGKNSSKGARLIKADLDSMFSDILGESSATTTAVDLHREAFEAVQSLLEDKCDGDKSRELRELISVAQSMLNGLNAEEEMTPRERSERATRYRFGLVN